MHPGILSISEVDSFARATELGYSCTTPFKASLKTSNQSPPSPTAEIAAFRPSNLQRMEERIESLIFCYFDSYAGGALEAMTGFL